MITHPVFGSRWRHRTDGYEVEVTAGHSECGHLDLVGFRGPKHVMPKNSIGETAVRRSLFLAEFVNLDHEQQPPGAKKPMEFHPIANLFPLFDNDQLDDLSADIAENGLRDPIVTLDGLILDGRNRWRACMEIGMEPAFIEYDQAKHGEPLAYVVSHNLHRRHLTESQRAMVAANLTTYSHGGDRSEQAASLPGTTVEKAADMLNVSPRSVQTARRVNAEAVPEVKAAVETGEVSVSSAAEVATLPPEQQREAAAGGGKAIRESAVQSRRARGAKDSELFTPENILESARRTMGDIDLDPASSHEANERVGAKVFYTVAQDGLSQGEWEGRVFMNPPAKLVSEFVANLVTDYKAGKVTEAIAVLPSETAEGWYQQVSETADAVCFPLGRLKFETVKGAVSGNAPASSIFYLGNEPGAFALQFDKHGICWVR